MANDDVFFDYVPKEPWGNWNETLLKELARIEAMYARPTTMIVEITDDDWLLDKIIEWTTLPDGRTDSRQHPLPPPRFVHAQTEYSWESWMGPLDKSLISNILIITAPYNPKLLQLIVQGLVADGLVPRDADNLSVRFE